MLSLSLEIHQKMRWKQEGPLWILPNPDALSKYDPNGSTGDLHLILSWWEKLHKVDQLLIRRKYNYEDNKNQKLKLQKLAMWVQSWVHWPYHHDDINFEWGEQVFHLAVPQLHIETWYFP